MDALKPRQKYLIVAVMAVEVAVGNLVAYAVVITYDTGENACNYFNIRPVFFYFDKSKIIVPCGQFNSW